MQVEITYKCNKIKNISKSSGKRKTVENESRERKKTSRKTKTAPLSAHLKPSDMRKPIPATKEAGKQLCHQRKKTLCALIAPRKPGVYRKRIPTRQNAFIFLKKS